MQFCIINLLKCYLFNLFNFVTYRKRRPICWHDTEPTFLIKLILFARVTAQLSYHQRVTNSLKEQWPKELISLINYNNYMALLIYISRPKHNLWFTTSPPIGHGSDTELYYRKGVFTGHWLLSLHTWLPYTMNFWSETTLSGDLADAYVHKKQKLGRHLL